MLRFLFPSLPLTTAAAALSRSLSPSFLQAPREVKVVLLGDTGVGKSSIVLRFVTNSFEKYSESTIGCVRGVRARRRARARAHARALWRRVYSRGAQVCPPLCSARGGSTRRRLAALSAAPRSCPS